MKKQLTEKDVLHLAKLANLQLSPEEVNQYEKQLEQTIEYVENLKELNTEQVAPSSHTTGKTNTFFEDGTKNERGFTEEEALKNAKKTKKSYFVVGKVL